VPRDLCTDCGISRTAEPKRCGRACQFIKPDYPGLERQVHGRARDPARPDEHVPPDELLEPIEQHVTAGNIRRILEAADSIRRADQSYAGVADRITAMAQEFQVNRLADYIKRLRRAKVEGDG